VVYSGFSSHDAALDYRESIIPPMERGRVRLGFCTLVNRVEDVNEPLERAVFNVKCKYCGSTECNIVPYNFDFHTRRADDSLSQYANEWKLVCYACGLEQVDIRPLLTRR
jgi:hypothetical protein